ncbi:hypothetical protein [Streptomyces sp. NBC_01233]|uniref:hypothetical protein n=1 Tax=Streptomyces sp. NBC_01233 TaxID=2903787 RepID=UPI002E165AC2|nr:hypothetical protein OG332_14215 [Streptomyces sp. NBC_01233]
MNVRELRKLSKQLGFTPQEQVRWLAPKELARTAVKAALAAVFANYSDKREIQGALDEADLLSAPPDKPDAEEIWIDFVADLGDGFDATSSVAFTLAAQMITCENGATPLPRGSLLVLGGDQVYPVASATGYEDRLQGPYRAALPGNHETAADQPPMVAPPGNHETAADQPLMVALPGNHDWYDGLTSFLRMFVQERSIGGWQTRQKRSYFAVRLPQQWWLIGLDSQLGSYFDDPQLHYFQTHLSANLQPGDGVIVCSAEPTWVESAEDRKSDAFNALHWFDRNIIRTKTDPTTGEPVPTGASIRLWLTGDKHHYARYAEQLPGEDPAGSDGLPPDPRRRQMVTCGMGGAFLAATHRLPPVLRLPPGDSRMRSKDDPPPAFALARETYPSAEESRRIARHIALPWNRNWLVWRNPGFAAPAAGLHVGLFLLMSFLFALAEGAPQPVDAVRRAGVGDIVGFVAIVLFAELVLVVLGCAARLIRKRKLAAPSRTTTAVLLQLAVALVALAITVAIPFPPACSGWIVVLACLFVAALTGAAVGSEAFALWTLSVHDGVVAEWPMSGQSIEDHKGFVRIHIAQSGTLTLYPLALDGICRDWDVQDLSAGGMRPVPRKLPAVRLIEAPIVIDREAARP